MILPKLLMFVVLVLLAAAPIASHGAPAPKEKGQVPQVVQSASEPSLSAKLELENKVQAAQLSAVKEYHSSLLDTVYWALGTLATVTALLAGFGWFANFKLYEADKTRLKEELQRMIADVDAQAVARLSSKELDLLQKVDGRLDALSQRISTDFQSIRTEMSDLAKTFSESKTNASAQLSELKTSIDDLTKDIRGVESSMRQVEEHIWDLKKIPGNKLITQSQALDAGLKSGQRYLVVSALERMGETIKNEILPNKVALSETVFNSMAETLKSAVAIAPIPASAVAELLQSVPKKVKTQ